MGPSHLINFLNHQFLPGEGGPINLTYIVIKQQITFFMKKYFPKNIIYLNLFLHPKYNIFRGDIINLWRYTINNFLKFSNFLHKLDRLSNLAFLIPQK